MGETATRESPVAHVFRAQLLYGRLAFFPRPNLIYSAGHDSTEPLGQWISGFNLLLGHNQNAKVLNCIQIHHKAMQNRSVLLCLLPFANNTPLSPPWGTKHHQVAGICSRS